MTSEDLPDVDGVPPQIQDELVARRIAVALVENDPKMKPSDAVETVREAVRDYREGDRRSNLDERTYKNRMREIESQAGIDFEAAVDAADEAVETWGDVMLWAYPVGETTARRDSFTETLSR